MHYTRLTLFHVIWLASVAALCLLGAVSGLRLHGVVGGVAGGVVGLLVGHLLGSLPNALAQRWLARHLERASSEELWSIVAREYWGLTQTLALLKLRALGERVDGELPRIVGMLESESEETRLFGWDALRIVFPELHGVILDYDPRGPSDARRAETALLREHLDARGWRLPAPDGPCEGEEPVEPTARG